MNKEEQKTHTSDMVSFMNKIEEEVRTHDTQEMMIKTVYRIHKPLKDLRYTRTHKEVQEVLYNLRFLLIYDKEDFIDFIVMLEYFFKIHYNIMIGKYDVQTYYSVLKDIRKEILNAMYSTFLNIPEKSTVYDHKNLSSQLKRETKKIQAITYKYMKILSHKYRSQITHDTYKGAQGIDNYRDNHYDMVY